MSDAHLVGLSSVAYDQERRLQAAGVIAFAVGSAGAIFTGFVTLYILRGRLAPAPAGIAYALDSVLVCAVSMFALGGIAAFRHIAGVAEGCTIFAINLGVITFELIWVFPLGNGVDPVVLVAFAADGVVIGIAGALGKPWMVLATMGLMNVLTVALIVFAPANHLLGPTFAQERALYLPLALLIQWAIAAIVLAMDLIYRRTVADVTQAYEQAKRLDELKDQFIAHINHELRTPIMALHGYVEYMLTTLPELSHEEVIDSLSRASRTGHKLVALLESILDVRRIDQQTPFDREPVSIQEALEAALQMIDPREATPAHRAIAISVPGELRIWGEATRLQQILTNLISNAIKYSPPTTPIEIRARDVIEARMAPTGPWPWKTARQEREMVEIAVRDYGLGVPPDQIPLLFNRFVRLPRDLASKVHGNGLGLYLCRTMAQAMDGAIWLESSGIEGEGTTIYLRLPLFHSSECLSGASQASTTEPCRQAAWRDQQADR